ncbi:hypothetical protein FRC09_005376 [Ceratobasidium sp. 395]|nr:hypothetical protein FRC09_005376 [Ceratobasidium sp. 395]
MTSGQLVANRISINAAEQDDYIESVTVFQADRAEVKRRIKLELKQGQNYIDVERLPNCISEDSIRVEGTGTAIIFDVVYRSPPWGTPVPIRDAAHQQAVSSALYKLESLQKEREVAKEQSALLSSYSKTLDGKNTSIEDIGRFLDMFGPRQVAFSKRVQELDAQVIQAGKDYDDAQGMASTDQRGSKRGAKITVTVFAEVDGQAELMLTYGTRIINIKLMITATKLNPLVVSNASWTPLYDVRATVAKSPDAASAISLHYRASVMQTTGENWSNVALTLSTASPQLGGSVPNLTTWRIGPTPDYSPASPRFVPTSPCYSPASPRYSPMTPYDAPQFATYSAPAAPRVAFRPVKVVDTGVLSATFSISGRSDIPSDNTSHKVVIAILDLEAELEWISVPREKILNTSEFTLLPGETNVFMDDNFVSKSRIEHVAPADSFTTSLGTDSAIRVTYPSVRTLNRTIDQSSFFSSKESKQSVSAFAQRITVRNSRSSTISTLRILDHVPVSTDAQFKVKVLSPKGLGPVTEEGDTLDVNKNKDRSWISVQNGVKARWANLDVGGEGTVEWICEMKPNEELELELSWEVSAPAGQKWQSV